MLNLLELARKWLKPGAIAAATDAGDAKELEELESFNKRVGEIWLTYHENAPWAIRKLANGLRLTPEALDYMEREVEVRRLADEALKKNLAIKDSSDVEAIIVSQRQPAVHGASDGTDAGSSIPQGS